MIRRLFFWFAGVNVLRLQDQDKVLIKLQTFPTNAQTGIIAAFFSPAKVLFYGNEIEKIQVVRHEDTP